MDFNLTPGQAADCTHGPGLLVGRRADAALGDRAYDTADFRAAAREAGAQPVVPAKRNRVAPEPHDAHLYKARHAIENGFAKLKRFRALATRYDKTARHYAATVALACIAIWAKLV